MSPRPPASPTRPPARPPSPKPTTPRAPTLTLDPSDFDLSGADPETLSELKDLVLATIADVMETGSPEQQVDMVKKFGPAILKEHVDQTGGVDIDAALDVCRQMLRRAGVHYFEGAPLALRDHR